MWVLLDLHACQDFKARPFPSSITRKVLTTIIGIDLHGEEQVKRGHSDVSAQTSCLENYRDLQAWGTCPQSQHLEGRGFQASQKFHGEYLSQKKNQDKKIQAGQHCSYKLLSSSQSGPPCGVREVETAWKDVSSRHYFQQSIGCDSQTRWWTALVRGWALAPALVSMTYSSATGKLSEMASLCGGHARVTVLPGPNRILLTPKGRGIFSLNLRTGLKLLVSRECSRTFWRPEASTSSLRNTNTAM